MRTDAETMRSVRSSFERAVALMEDEQLEDALVAFQEVVERVGDASESQLLAFAVAARYNAAIVLQELGRDEAMMAFISLVNDFADRPSPAYDEYLADAGLAVG